MSCPINLIEKEVISLAHGSGGKEMSQLIGKMFIPAFANEQLNLQHDGALLNIPSDNIVFTTDSYVIQPIFFPGGDIGKLAVTGTINDLSMCGAIPKYLSCSFIIEEGFLQKDLAQIVTSMKQEADLNSVQIVTGDTKVIERQSGPNIFINTSGIGMLLAKQPIHPQQIKPNDAILLSGDIGRHGMTIMALREGLSFSSPLISDCQSLTPVVQSLIQNDIQVHCLRDATRGGLATVLIELAESSKLNFTINEESICISQSVKSACELLGLDPLYVANEGCFIAIVPHDQADSALSIMQQFSPKKQASIIGKVGETSTSAKVQMKNSFGSSRYLYTLTGEQLPRIC